MIWVVAYRGGGEKTAQLATSGRAAAIVAAVAMIEKGVEVLSVTDQEKTQSVSEDEIRRVGELSHAPSIQSMFGMSGRDERHDIPADIRAIRMMASAQHETEPLRRGEVATVPNKHASSQTGT
jgi:hypothetical protein